LVNQPNSGQKTIGFVREHYLAMGGSVYLSLAGQSQETIQNFEVQLEFTNQTVKQGELTSRSLA